MTILLITLTIMSNESSTLIPPPFTHTLGFNRISSYYINMYLGNVVQVDNPEGLCCTKIKEEDDPTTWRDDALLTLFAVNSGTGQIVYNVNLSNLKTFGTKGSGAGQFNNPHGITCNENGDVYIADTGNRRIVHLRYFQGELRWITVVDSTLELPYDVSLDSRGNLYAVDAGDNRILVYSPDDSKIQTISTELEYPTAIAVIDRLAPFNEQALDRIVVVDRFGNRINQINRSGEIIRSVDCRSIGLDTANLSYCAFDRYGNSFVTDRINHQIHIFDHNLKYITSFGRPANALGSQPVFNSPRGIAINRKFGQLFVSEQDGGQYYLIALDGWLIGCFPERFDSLKPGTTIAFYLTQRAEITIDIINSSGDIIKTLTPPYQYGPGEALVVWDGQDNQGLIVPPGEYSIRITIRPTYSRPRYTFKKELRAKVFRIPG